MCFYNTGKCTPSSIVLMLWFLFIVLLWYLYAVWVCQFVCCYYFFVSSFDLQQNCLFCKSIDYKVIFITVILFNLLHLTPHPRNPVKVQLLL